LDEIEIMMNSIFRILEAFFLNTKKKKKKKAFLKLKKKKNLLKKVKKKKKKTFYRNLVLIGSSLWINQTFFFL